MRRLWAVSGALTAFVIGSLTSPVKATNSYLISLFSAALEERFLPSPPPDESSLAGIIAVGGRSYRIAEAGVLARRYPNLTVAVSGAGARAEVEEMLGAGIGPARKVIDENARTTRQNALVMASQLRPTAGKRWLLVTSALHMPRAVAAFRAAGFDVEPWPVRDDLNDPYTFDEVIHEWFGLAFYRAVGWSNELWPEPHPSPGEQVAQRTGPGRVLNSLASADGL